MASRPVVGVKKLNLGRLSPQVIRILKQQSMGQANRVAKAYQPQIQAIAAQRGAINQTYRQEVGSARGAVGLEQAYLGKALKGAKGSGLQGQFLKQYTGALGSRMAGSASTIPFLTADAGVTRAKDLTSLSSDILKARADQATARQKTFATEFGSGLTSARLHAASALKSQKTASGSGGLSATDKRKLHSASQAFKDAYGVWQQNAKVNIGTAAAPKWTTPQKLNPLQSEADWRKFAFGLASAPQYGISSWEALKVTQQYSKDVQRRRRTRRTGLPPGVGGAFSGYTGLLDPGLKQLLGH